MKKLLTVKIEGYEFEDLTDKAQQIAIFDTANFWVFISDDSEADYNRIKDAIDEAERLQTPHFLQSIVAEKYEKEIIEQIKAAECLFNIDGAILPILNHYDSNGDLTHVTYDSLHETIIENYTPETKGDVL